MSNELVLQEIKKAVGAHGAWKLKLRTAISMGSSDASPEQVKCDNLCEFGKWLYGPTVDASMKRGKPYQVIKRLHAEFHECASEVLALALNDKKSEAIAMLDGSYKERSEKLVRALYKWKRELSDAVAVSA